MPELGMQVSRMLLGPGFIRRQECPMRERFDVRLYKPMNRPTFEFAKRAKSSG
jgi:hypothetical protein